MTPLPEAIIAALLSAHVYCPADDDDAGALPPGWIARDQVEVNGFRIRAYASEREGGGSLAIVVRGTVTFSNWLFNVAAIGKSIVAAQVSDEANVTTVETVLMSAGFDKELSSLCGFTENTITEAAKRKPPPRRIFVCGHSLGGFLAQVLAVEFDLDGYSFNAPALGTYRVMSDLKFAEKRDNYKHRFENHCVDGDLVSGVEYNRSHGHLGTRHVHRSELSLFTASTNVPLELHRIDKFAERLQRYQCGHASEGRRDACHCEGSFQDEGRWGILLSLFRSLPTLQEMNAFAANSNTANLTALARLVASGGGGGGGGGGGNGVKLGEDKNHDDAAALALAQHLHASAGDGFVQTLAEYGMALIQTAYRYFLQQQRVRGQQHNKLLL